MKNILILATLLSFNAFAGEKECIEKTVELKQVLKGEKTDPALTGFLNLIPELREKLTRELEDPYRCSLEK